MPIKATLVVRLVTVTPVALLGTVPTYVTPLVWSPVHCQTVLPEICLQASLAVAVPVPNPTARNSTGDTPRTSQQHKHVPLWSPRPHPRPQAVIHP